MFSALLQASENEGTKTEQYPIVASRPADTGMRGYDLPTALKLLEVHGGISDYLVLGTWESDRPPSKRECEVRLEQPDLNPLGLNESHRGPTRIPVHIGIVKLLPAVKLLRTDDDQQFGRVPVYLHIPVDVVGIPAIEHFEQDFMHLLVIRLGDG